MLIIEKQKINDLIRTLAKNTPVYIPVRREQKEAIESIFEKFSPEMEIDFDYLPTLLSVKEFFLPPKEDIFVFDRKENMVSSALKPKPFILFGLNNRDLEAIQQLDEIMTKPNPDYFYLQKRAVATIVGLSNEPASANWRTPLSGDLILVKINEEQYEAVILTEKGKELAKNKIFKNEVGIITNAGPKSAEPEIMPQLKKLLYDSELIADAISWSWQNDQAVWDELAGLCLGCGICTYVCPLCYCFFIENSINLDEKECSRCRAWDACTLPKFAQISGGFNFHKTIKERYYNWYYHKFVRAYKEYGKSQCVACGRCQKYCPAKIDIEKYIVRIVDNYKKAIGLS
ncbi:MAG: 4Fe-4S dicluster domain-containing protein [bacterium]|nr:4Fe-4S dicluster domain-containing protein [bacterium]